MKNEYIDVLLSILGCRIRHRQRIKTVVVVVVNSAEVSVRDIATFAH